MDYFDNCSYCWFFSNSFIRSSCRMVYLFPDKLRLVLLVCGCYGAEEVHALRQIGDVNIRLRCLHHTLPVEGVDLHLGKLIGCPDVQDVPDRHCRQRLAGVVGGAHAVAAYVL